MPVNSDVMARRILEYRDELSYAGMSNACAAGMRPARRVMRKRNFGFTDRTGQTRKRIGLVKKYARATQKRRGGGGAYIRAGSQVGVLLEYGYNGRFSYIAPAIRQALPEMEAAFTQRAQREVDRAIQRAIARTGGRV